MYENLGDSEVLSRARYLAKFAMILFIWLVTAMLATPLLFCNEEFHTLSVKIMLSHT